MNSTATFEEEEIDETEMENRIMTITENYPWIVSEQSGIITGYAYAKKWKDRQAYRYSAESSVYVHRNEFGKGIGHSLLNQLLEIIAKKKIHNLIAGIALPNEASIVLHESSGFKKCGQFNEVGYKFGNWIDVGYWEKML